MNIEQGVQFHESARRLPEESQLLPVASLSTRASCLFELNRFLDHAVLEQLLAERRSLADDLDLLESLSEASSKSPDIEALAIALLGRIEDLLEREDRVLYQPLLRLAESTESTESAVNADSAT